MQTASLVFGVLAIIGMLIGFLPCLGALNWLNIPFAGLGLIVSVVALANAKGQDNGASVSGLVCCTIAILVGLFRLVVGGGIL